MREEVNTATRRDDLLRVGRLQSRKRFALQGEQLQRTSLKDFPRQPTTGKTTVKGSKWQFGMQSRSTADPTDATVAVESKNPSHFALKDHKTCTSHKPPKVETLQWLDLHGCEL